MGHTSQLIADQLAIYEEFWKTDHDSAMECRDGEDAIAFGLNVAEFIRGRERNWRDQVFRGTTPLADADAENCLSAWRVWLDSTERFLASAVAGLERQFGAVEGADELRAAAAAVRGELRDWQPPRLSSLVGLREIPLTAEAAEALDRILDAPAPPLPVGPKLEALSPSEFLARVGRSS